MNVNLRRLHRYGNNEQFKGIGNKYQLWGNRGNGNGNKHNQGQQSTNMRIFKKSVIYTGSWMERIFSEFHKKSDKNNATGSDHSRKKIEGKKQKLHDGGFTWQTYSKFDPDIQILWSWIKIKPSDQRIIQRDQEKGWYKRRRIYCLLTSMWRFEREKTFLALVDTWSSQILAGVHTMGNVGGEIERAS